MFVFLTGKRIKERKKEREKGRNCSKVESSKRRNTPRNGIRYPQMGKTKKKRKEEGREG